MFRLVGFDCKGQVIPSASLIPSTTDYESIQKRPHNQVRRSPAPAPNNQALSHSPVIVMPSVPKAQDTRTGNGHTRAKEGKGHSGEPGLQETTVEPSAVEPRSPQDHSAGSGLPGTHMEAF